MLIPNLVLAVADANSDKGWGIEILVGLIGIGGTILGFWLNLYYQENKEKIEGLKEYIAALQSAANELEFYRAKLVQLSGELEAISNVARAWRSDWIIPTYSIYPNFLERCKITINTFQKNPYLVKEIGHCHFELCHILERLNLLKQDLRAPLSTDAGELTQQLRVHVKNAQGFKELVDSNIPVFKAACEAILADKRKMEDDLRLQRERSLVSNLVD